MLILHHDFKILNILHTIQDHLFILTFHVGKSHASSVTPPSVKWWWPSAPWQAIATHAWHQCCGTPHSSWQGWNLALLERGTDLWAGALSLQETTRLGRPFLMKLHVERKRTSKFKYWLWRRNLTHWWFWFCSKASLTRAVICDCGQKPESQESANKLPQAPQHTRH